MLRGGPAPRQHPAHRAPGHTADRKQSGSGGHANSHRHPSPISNACPNTGTDAAPYAHTPTVANIDAHAPAVANIDAHSHTIADPAPDAYIDTNTYAHSHS